jgi:putative transcriptional regulator
MDSLQGCLLVASPALGDGNFRRAVVLIVQHGDEGALGLILNRPTELTLDKVVEKTSGGPCACKEILHLGGPCEGPLMALHTQPELGEIEVLPGVFFSASSEPMREVIDRQPQPVRMFGGYSGWAPGQLESELEVEAWLTVPALAKHIFGSERGLWERLCRGLSVLSVLQIKDLPRDPSLN